MPLRLWKQIILAQAAAMAFALTTAHAPAAVPTPPRTPIRIEVPSASNLQFLTLWVAVGAGLFRQEGLEPEIEVAPAPRSTGQMLLGGKADIAVLPPPMFLGMMAEDKPIRLFASLLANEPINLIVRKDVAEARALSAKASLRERLAAIGGLRIGLAGEVAPRLRAIFASGGLDADSSVEPVIIAGPDQMRAFTDGRVDVLFAHTPYLETAIVDYGAVLLVQPSGGEVPVLADGQVHALATTRELARSNPDKIEKAARAIYHALRLIRSNREKSVDALLSYGRAGADRRLLNIIVAVYSLAVPRTPQLSLEGIEHDAVLYPAHPKAPDFAKVKAADFVAPAFAEHAIAAKP